MGEGRGCENTTGMPTLAKTTLNVPYWLTTEMGECRGWENSTGMPTLAKTTLNVLYRLTTEMGECRGCENSTGMPSKDDIKCTLQADHRNGGRASHRNVAPAKAQKGIKLIYCPWGGGGIWLLFLTYPWSLYVPPTI